MTTRRGALGFGLMRLPKKGLGIDIDETSRMVDRFLEAGYTYFDTAHVYIGSEEAAKKALVATATPWPPSCTRAAPPPRRQPKSSSRPASSGPARATSTTTCFTP